MIQTIINNNLRAVFNVDEDVRYKALVSDIDGTNPDTVTKPTDIDIGVIASQIEYLRRLSIDLLKQIYIDEASGEFLKYQLEEFFSSLRLEDETDVNWVQRTISIVIKSKVSRASIIVALRPYSDAEPEITTVQKDNAFADFSYSDIYIKDETTLDGRIIFILPAITENYLSSAYTIKIILTNTPLSEIYSVQDIISKVVAAGISVILQINYI